MPEAAGARTTRRPRRRLLTAVALAALLLGATGAGAAAGQVTELNGSAYGVFASVSLFGGPPGQVGATPVVVLPADGTRQEASRPRAIAQYGPATIFGGQYTGEGRNPSGRLTVSTEGKAGSGGFVKSSASVVNIGPGPLIADKMTSSCRSDEEGVTGSVTIDEGVVETSYDPETQEPATTEDIPARPAPNTTIEGEITHVGDRFRIVLNEQVVEGDTIVVRAAHMYLLGDIAVGDMIIGQSVCGLSAGDESTAPPTTAAGANAPATTEPPGMTTEPDTELDGQTAAEEGPDGDGPSLVVVGAVAAAALAVGGGIVAPLLRRRRRRPASPTAPPGDG